MSRAMSRMFLAAALVCVTAAVSQAQTTTSTTTQTKKFEVIAVDGNDLVVKLPEGTREMTVPDDFRFTVDGQQLSVRDLKPGMKGTAQITTKTTVIPVTVTEVKNGTVMQSGGASITVKTDTGIKMFTQADMDKRGVKIMREGKPAQISDFRTGDQLTATIITSHPPKIVTEKQVNASLAKAAPGAGAAAGGAAGGGAPAAAKGTGTAKAAPSAGAPPAAAAPAPTTGTAKKLPKTASSWPLLGLVSFLSLAMGFALTVRRRFAR